MNMTSQKNVVLTEWHDQGQTKTFRVVKSFNFSDAEYVLEELIGYAAMGEKQWKKVDYCYAEKPQSWKDSDPTNAVLWELGYLAESVILRAEGK